MTDFALRATKVTARSLWKAMSTMVVQERHLWLNLAEMKDVDKARFLDAPISQAGLFGDTVEGFAQQFSTVQQQTEAIQHILPRRDAPSTAAPGARPQSARRRGRPPVSSRAAPPQAESTHRPVRRASRRRGAPPVSQPGPKSGPEPLYSVELKFLSIKTALLTALTSIKRVGDLQAFSVSEECLVFGPVYSHVVLRPRPGYVPKVPTTPFRDQVVNLQALPSEEADPALALLCPVRALLIYVDRTRSVRSSEQLFVCHGGQQKGKAVSKQRLAHWIVEAVALAY